MAFQRATGGEGNAGELIALGRRIKEIGDRGLNTQITRAVRAATADARAEVKKSALEKLPKRGGLNQRVANSRVTVRTRTSARTAGVRITAARKGSDLRRIDEGIVRHPVFGNRDNWVSQQVEPGFFTDPMEREGPKTRLEVNRALERVAASLAGRSAHVSVRVM